LMRRALSRLYGSVFVRLLLHLNELAVNAGIKLSEHFRDIAELRR
jgi:hypothetical protein